MGMAASDALLTAMFGGVLLAVISLISLVWACPPQTDAHSQLFAKGTVPPYTAMVSLKASFLLPWHSSPDFAGCRSVAPWSLVLARVGAALSILALVALITLEVLNAWV
jgi:hypothetical protein